MLLDNGDEITLALRLSTRGYKIFTIKSPIVWHLNKFHGDLYYKDRLMGSEVIGKERDLYGQRSDKSLDRVKDILTGKIFGYWGAPSLEKLKEFEQKINLDFNKFYSE